MCMFQNWSNNSPSRTSQWRSSIVALTPKFSSCWRSTVSRVSVTYDVEYGSCCNGWSLCDTDRRSSRGVVNYRPPTFNREQLTRCWKHKQWQWPWLQRMEQNELTLLLGAQCAGLLFSEFHCEYLLTYSQTCMSSFWARKASTLRSFSPRSFTSCKNLKSQTSSCHLTGSSWWASALFGQYWWQSSFSHWFWAERVSTTCTSFIFAGSVITFNTCSFWEWLLWWWLKLTDVSFQLKSALIVKKYGSTS